MLATTEACTEAEMDGGRGLIVSPWKGGKVAGLAHNLVVRSWLTPPKRVRALAD